MQGEGAEGLSPAVDGGAFDEPAGGFAFAAGQAFLLRPGAGAFVFDLADREPEQFDRGIVRGKVAAVLDDLAKLVVQRLDRVGGVDDLPELGVGTPGTG